MLQLSFRKIDALLRTLAALQVLTALQVSGPGKLAL